MKNRSCNVFNQVGNEHLAFLVSCWHLNPVDCILNRGDKFGKGVCHAITFSGAIAYLYVSLRLLPFECPQ
ncbi:hypothetical protein MTR67_001152 [Solanum verrucosum]|uniref:Uncharacterized protein n=1 Tax=Solanum verrucosum TaxID=315347 RepID=A0AAF0PN38_SOLVR|nr:hypothetical protein MTR67_001152 [Solanum verrucosum]